MKRQMVFSVILLSIIGSNNGCSLHTDIEPKNCKYYCDAKYSREKVGIHVLASHDHDDKKRSCLGGSMENIDGEGSKICHAVIHICHHKMTHSSKNNGVISKR